MTTGGLRAIRAYPHRIAVIGTLVCALAAIVVVEMTGAGRWVAEDGLIHLVGVVFVVLAFVITLRLRGQVVGEFKPFLTRVLIAQAILGFSHFVEYLIEEGLEVDSSVAPLYVSAFYTLALAAIIASALMLLRPSLKEAWKAWAFVAVGAGVPIVAVMVVIPAVGSGRTLRALLAILDLTLVMFAFYATGYFSRIRKKLPILAPVMGHVNVAVVATMVAALVESGIPFLEPGLPFPNWVYENASHYIFYAGLTFLCLAFDFPYHFGGVYADMRKET